MDKCTKSTALPDETPEETQMYTAQSIEVLHGLEAVRRRPGMYVGDTDDGSGLLNCILETVTHLAGSMDASTGGTIEMTLGLDGQIEVRDDGRGMPTDLHPKMGRSAAELIMTELHCGWGEPTPGTYAVNGVHGLGVEVTNALSASMVLEIRRDGRVYEQSYLEGVPQGPLVAVGYSRKTGTRFVFTPDPTIFSGVGLDRDRLEANVRTMAMQCPGLTMVVRDVSDGWLLSVAYPEGPRSMLDEILAQGDCAMRAPGSFVLTGSGEEDWQNWIVTVALGWRESVRGQVHSVVLGRHTHRGGEHHRGLYEGLATLLERFARGGGLSGPKDPSIEAEDVREGLFAVMAVTCLDRWGNASILNQCGTSVRSEAFGDEVARIVSSRFGPMLADYPELVEAIVGIALANARRRVAFGLER